MEQEINGVTEKFNSKCFEYDSLERELFGVKDALNEALQTIDALEKVRKEAKENQVKCCVLEEQIEVSDTFPHFMMNKKFTWCYRKVHQSVSLLLNTLSHTYTHLHFTRMTKKKHK